MKTYRNLYRKLCSLENLQLAFKKARKHKTEKLYVQEFEKNLTENLQKLHEELTIKTYTPLPLKTFILKDPKTRKISVSDFRDRIVHHAICNVLEPIFDKRFIHDSYTNRKRKGALAALKRFDEFKRKVSLNGRLVRNITDDNFVQGYALKADIKHYFDTVDHERLLEIIGKRIADKETLELVKKILSNHTTKPGKGMPLGNLTSQFFANVYLNELDQYIKHELRVKYYLRYVDDFAVLHRSRKQLERWKESINNFLHNELLLELHPQKSRTIPLGRGIDFLGFKCFYHFRLLRGRNIRKMRRRLEKLKDLLNQGKISKTDVMESLHGWKAYAAHANTHKLQREMTNNAIKIIQKPSTICV